MDATSISLTENICKSEEAIHSIDFMFKPPELSAKGEFLSNGAVDCEKPTKKKQKLDEPLVVNSLASCASSSLSSLSSPFPQSPTLETDETSMDSLSVSVVTLMGNVFVINDLYPDDSLDVLKMNIFEVSGVFPENQILLLNGNQLPQTSSLAIRGFGIVNHSLLKLFLYMSGGPGNFMVDSFSNTSKRSQDILEDELDFSSNSLTIEELSEYSGCDDFLYDPPEDLTGESHLDSVSSSLANQPLASKTFIYRSESGGIFFVEITGAYTDISLLTLLQTEQPTMLSTPMVSSSQAHASMLASPSLHSQTTVPEEQHHSLRQCSPMELVVPACGSRPVMSMEELDHCFVCNRKVRETLRYPCKCLLIFCKSHRPPHLHDCSFDYCTANKKELGKTSPLMGYSALREFQ